MCTEETEEETHEGEATGRQRHRWVEAAPGPRNVSRHGGGRSAARFPPGLRGARPAHTPAQICGLQNRERVKLRCFVGSCLPRPALLEASAPAFHGALTSQVDGGRGTRSAGLPRATTRSPLGGLCPYRSLPYRTTAFGHLLLFSFPTWIQLRPFSRRPRHRCPRKLVPGARGSAWQVWMLHKRFVDLRLVTVTPESSFSLPHTLVLCCMRPLLPDLPEIQGCRVEAPGSLRRGRALAAETATGPSVQGPALPCVALSGHCLGVTVRARVSDHQG